MACVDRADAVDAVDGVQVGGGHKYIAILVRQNRGHAPSFISDDLDGVLRPNGAINRSACDLSTVPMSGATSQVVAAAAKYGHSVRRSASGGDEHD